MTTTNQNPNKELSTDQAAKILKYLQTGRKLTAIQAFDKFQCFRLAARIHDLKEEHDIKSEFIKINGKRVKRYFL